MKEVILSIQYAEADGATVPEYGVQQTEADSRTAAQFLGSATAAAAVGNAVSAHAANQVLKIGASFSLTGADAHGSKLILDGARLAFDEASKANAAPGYTFEVVSYDDAAATAS